MKKALLAGVLLVGATLMQGSAFAKDIPDGGLTVNDVAKWLQDGGYKAEIQSNSDGTKKVHSATDGVDFYVDMYDCKGKPQCESIQFYAGFDSKGAWNATKMNTFNAKNRWVKVYVDDKDDPWVEMDVDLLGSSYDGLDDEFAVWRQMLGDFTKYIDW
jgi:hypothetical protein